jgi:putative methanogenesis marker protein 8
MTLKNVILYHLEKEGEFILGSVSFKLEGQGIVLRFEKKRKIPVNLLTGISQKDLEKAVTPEINISSLVDHTVEVREDNAERFTLYKKGNIEDGLDTLLNCCRSVQEIYDKFAVHINRMFGRYILISKIEEKLSAIYSTQSPIKYCPLMYKLLKEIGKKVAEKLLFALENGEEKECQKLMLDLINDVVIADGGFADSRPLNSCERNVTFGASEIMSDAMQEGKLDAAVIVSNNIGTLVTTSPNTTQGVVKRMTGLFYTTPSPSVIDRAFEEGILPVFPFTGEIDQVEGLREAIKQGNKRISVSVAADDNAKLKELAELEKDGLTVYRFSLCATGVSDETATIMADYADIAWACASKQVREIVAPKALAQVGIKIPVYIMSERGWELVKPRIKAIDPSFNVDSIKLEIGKNMPIIFNNDAGLSMKLFKEMNMNCVDCPSPCV